MYLIVGLGNPEEEYAKTRHNMGFDTINKLAEKYNIKINKNKFQGLVGTGIIENEKVVLLKPQTYMNLSGEAVREAIDFYKLSNDKIIIIYDDIDIEPEEIKVRKTGSAGGHNGMKSVISNLKTEQFARIRIGIGKPQNKEDMVNYVIGNITNEEYNKLQKGCDIARDATIEIVKNGIDIAMNKFNIKQKKGEI